MSTYQLNRISFAYNSSIPSNWSRKRVLLYLIQFILYVFKHLFSRFLIGCTLSGSHFFIGQTRQCLSSLFISVVKNKLCCDQSFWLITFEIDFCSPFLKTFAHARMSKRCCLLCARKVFSIFFFVI